MKMKIIRWRKVFSLGCASCFLFLMLLVSRNLISSDSSNARALDSSGVEFYDKLKEADLIIVGRGRKDGSFDVLRNRCEERVSGIIVANVRSMKIRNGLFIYNHDSGVAMSEGEIQFYPVRAGRVILDFGVETGWVSFEEIINKLKRDG